jgi:sulfonate transport system substrate-binding protein
MSNSLPTARICAAFLVLGVLAACDSSKSAGSTSAPSPGDGQPLVIRFSDPGNAGVFAYAKREGILERELAKVNARIEWVPGGGSFSATFDAMNSGAINASGGAISPIVGALSHKLPFRIYAVSDPAGTRRAGIVSPGTSSIRAVKDLVGKRVAVNLAAHGDYILLKALAHDGVPASEVTRVPIQPPDAAAAFATGKIDAWSTFGVFFSTAIRNGAHVVATEDQIESDDISVLSANDAVLEKSPKAFQVLLKVSGDLAALAHQSPEKFVNVFFDKGPTALSGEELRIATDETRAVPAFRIPNAADRIRIANVSKILFDNKSIDREISVAEIVFDLDEAAKRASVN